MNKRWLYGTIAGLVLLVSACGGGNSAAPGGNNTYGTTAYPAPNGYGGTASPATPAGEVDTNGPLMRQNGQTYQSLYKTSGIRSNRAGTLWNAAASGNDTTNLTQMGYVRVNSNDVRNGAMNNIYVDRDALAQIVGNVTAGVPGVNRSTVLVTDEEIFVGLDIANDNKQQAASIVKKAKMNAWSVSPRYYKVYVTDKRETINELSRIASRSANVNGTGFNDDQQIANLIHRFGGLTDGEDWPRSSGMTTEMTDRMDIGDRVKSREKKPSPKR